MALDYPTDEWYIKELAEHRRKQVKIKKALASKQTPTTEKSMTTIREQIEELIDRESERRFNFGFGRDNYGYSIEKARVELWATSTGRTLTDLLRSRYADMTIAEARAEVRKSKNDDSEAFEKGIKTLEAGFPR